MISEEQKELISTKFKEINKILESLGLYISVGDDYVGIREFPPSHKTIADFDLNNFLPVWDLTDGY